jgi:hypothetical protein
VAGHADGRAVVVGCADGLAVVAGHADGRAVVAGHADGRAVWWRDMQTDGSLLEVRSNTWTTLFLHAATNRHADGRPSMPRDVCGATHVLLSAC